MSTSDEARKKPNSGDSTMNAPVVSTPDHTIEPMPALVTPASSSPANQRM